MDKRYMAIWFRHLLTDWMIRRRPELRNIPFVLAEKRHGRKVITAAPLCVEKFRVFAGMVVADAKAAIPELEVIDEPAGQRKKILETIGEWLIRYTPSVAIDLPDGLILDISGCAHLWGGEREYLRELITRLRAGYDCRGAIADTIGAAWAVARYGTVSPIIEPGKHRQALMPLPPEALRLEQSVVEKLRRLGINTVEKLCRIPDRELRRRYGMQPVLRIGQAMGRQEEYILPLAVQSPYVERLPSMEPIKTAKGIEIAIENLLKSLCARLSREGKGLRRAVLKCYRVDNRIIESSIGTSLASSDPQHLLKLFQLNISGIAPGLGIELFTMNATIVEALEPGQESIWAKAHQNDRKQIAELLDRVAVKVGVNAIHRYLPAEHYWPERSVRESSGLSEKPVTSWPRRLLRPVQLLGKPHPIQVSAPIPDYPPMVFIYKDQVHEVRKADGPERIEREWWIDDGVHRDYYILEDAKGRRYWVFRLGHYRHKKPQQWFIHGFFA